MVKKGDNFVIKVVAGSATNETFSGINLDHLSWYKQSISEALIEKSDFTNCSFDDCRFVLSHFEEVNFKNSNLDGSDFTSAGGRELIFNNCNMNGVDFSYCDIEKLSLIDCRGKLKFKNSKLNGMYITASEIAGSDFCGSLLTDSFVYASDIRRILVNTSTDIEGTTFMESDIAQIKFSIVKGFNKKLLVDCIATPYLDSVQKIAETQNAAAKPTALDNAWDEEDYAMGYTGAGYGGYGYTPGVSSAYVHVPPNYKAHLYCSNLELYGKHKR